MKQNYYSGTVWEKEFAYCRAKRVNQFVFVAGTTAVDEQGQVVGSGDVYAQTVFIFSKIQKALQALGADLKDVVRTRIFAVDMTTFAQISKAHKEVFEGIDPVSSCIGISELVSKELLIEVEVDAIIE